MTVKEKVQRNYKALIAFLTPFILLLGVVSTNDAIASAFPDQTQWLIVVGIPAITALLTWLKRNQPTVTEALEIFDRAQSRAGQKPAE